MARRQQGLVQRAVGAIQQVAQQRFTPPSAQQVQRPSQGLVQRFAPQIQQGFNMVGRTLGQQQIINNPTPLRMQLPTVAQTVKLVDPHMDQSPVSQFLAGRTQDIVPSFQRNTHELAQRLRAGDTQTMVNMIPIGGAGTIVGKNAAGFANATGKFSALYDKIPRFEVSDKGARIIDVNKFDLEDKLTRVGKEMQPLNKKWLNKQATPDELKRLDTLAGEFNRLDERVRARANKEYKLGELFRHNELFKQYPDLRKVKVNFSSLSSLQGRGSYTPETNILTIDKSIFKNDPDKARQVILHEIQHAIQVKEGFAGGGNATRYHGTAREQAILNNITLRKRLNTYDPSNPYTNKTPIPTTEAEYRRLAEQYVDSPGGRFDSYQRLGGELEARSVAARSVLNQDELAHTLPYKDQGIPTKDIITRFDDGKVMGNKGLKNPRLTGFGDNESSWGRGDMVARERFNIPALKKLSSGGSDRDVYDLGNGKVLKVAKSARGLAQNMSEGELYAPVPKSFESGKNYVVVEKVLPPDANTKKLVNELKTLDSWKLSDNRHPEHYDEVNKAAEILNKYDVDGDSVMNYNVIWSDLKSLRNWGTNAEGTPVHLDAGTFNSDVLDQYKGIRNLDDPEFRDVYNQSRVAKSNFGDTDSNSMYSIDPKKLKGKTLGQLQEESQRAKGLGLLSDFDAALRSENFDLAKQIATKIKAAPKGSPYEPYKAQVDKFMPPQVKAPVVQSGKPSSYYAGIRDSLIKAANSGITKVMVGDKQVPIEDVISRYHSKAISSTGYDALPKKPLSMKGNVAKQLDQQLNAGGNKLPPSGGTVGAPPAGSIPPSDPVQKIIAALKTAKPLRREQEKLYSAERAKRVARVAAMGQKVGGEQGYFAQLGQLKGELPKLNFEGIRKQITQPDIDSLFNKVEQSPLSVFEKVTAKTGLSKVLGAEGGIVPTRNELQLLNEIFPPELTQALLDKRSLMQKLWGGTESALNLPRAIMATADLSAPLRQGAFLIGRPKQFIPAFKDMFKYAFSEGAYKDLQANIRSRPTYNAMREAKLSITDMSDILQGREEAFMSNLSERIPGFGHIARGSNRAYSGFLNKLRADTFDDLYRKAKSQDLLQENPKVLLEDIGKFVNSATGRGDLGALNRASVVLNSVFFSPRLMASRLNLINPIYYTQLDPFVRKEALKSLFSFAGTAATVLGLAKLGGADVGTDPRSADFGKIKIGNTRYDPWGGFQQYMVAASRLVSGQMVSSTTGREFNLGEGYKPTTRADIVTRLFQSKEAPVMSFITTLLSGQTAVGEKVSIPVEIADRFIPMVLQDMHDLVKEKGLEGIAMATPGIFGVGVQTYGNQIPQVTKTPTGRETVSYRQAPSLGEDIINKVTGTQISNVPEDLQRPIADEHLQQLKDQAEVDRAKQVVLQTGEAQQVGNTWVYLDNGIVTTKTNPGSSKELLNQIKGVQPMQYYSYFNQESGRPEFIPLNRPIYHPKLSGNSELDKKEYAKQASSYTSKINDIVKLYEVGQLDADSAEKQIRQLQAQQKATKAKLGRPRLRKVKLVKLKKIKLAKTKKIKVKKVKLAKIQLTSSKKSKA